MVELFVYGIILGGIIALGAIGLTLVYGILRFANFAHGDLMAVGAYLALFVSASVLPALGVAGRPLSPLSFGWPMLVALVVAMPLTGAVALLGDRLLYRRMRVERVSPVILAMASLAMALVLRSLVYIVWGPQFIFYSPALRPAWHLPFGVRIKPDQLFILGVVVVLVVGLALFLGRTRMGKAMRATADNPQLALVSGIDTDRVVVWTWMLGAGLAAAAGVLYGIDAQLRPDMGWSFLLPLFAAVILGGVGSVYGALGGSLVVGLAEALAVPLIGAEYRAAVAFLVLLAVLLVRPTGIAGARE